MVSVEEGNRSVSSSRRYSCLEDFVEWIDKGMEFLRYQTTQGFLFHYLKLRKDRKLGVQWHLHVSHLPVSGLGVWRKTWRSAR